jgi:hypothetical protein
MSLDAIQKSKKQKTPRDKEYGWELNEPAVIVSYTKNALHPAQGIYCVPTNRMHPLLKQAVELAACESDALECLSPLKKRRNISLVATGRADIGSYSVASYISCR